MSGDFGLIWWVIGLPLLGFLIQALVGKRLTESVGKRAVGFLAVAPIFASFAISVKLTLDLVARAATERNIVVTGPDWFTTSSLKVPFEWVVDPLSMTMVLIITGIGGLIHLYSTGYMSEERDYSRFFTYLNLFIVAMLVLVLGNNLILLFLGWEGVGLCSYLLIGFWYKDLANARAANKAFIVNRIGDWGLTLGIFLIVALLIVTGKSAPDGRMLSYDSMLPLLASALEQNPGVATAIALLLFVGAAGKSAQFPLYLWLPDAMAGPTPVSALIHAATMVTSGVVLLNRMNVVFQLSPVASAVIAIIGAFTALYAALIAFGQTDIKKVLAFSTVSQLGFMFIACGAGAYWAGMFHVTTHAFFKALLFLGAGAVIHAMAHNQDMRNYGGLFKYMKITGATMIVGWVAIAAVFGTSGWYSKEAILGAALAGDHASISGFNLGYISGMLGLLVAVLTAVYMTRLTMLTFFGKEERWRALPAEGHHVHEVHAAAAETSLDHEPTVHVSPVEVVESAPQEFSTDLPLRDDPHGFYMSEEEARSFWDAKRDAAHHELGGDHTPHEVSPSMWLPLVILAVLSVAGGYFLHHNGAFEKWLYPQDLAYLGQVPTHPEGIDLEKLSMLAGGLGIVVGLFGYFRGLPANQGHDESKWSRWRRLAGEQFGYDRAVTVASVEGGGDIARGVWKWIDDGIVDGAVNGSAWLASTVGRGFRALQTGYIRLYALIMLIGGVALIGYFLLVIARLGGGR